MDSVLLKAVAPERKRTRRDSQSDAESKKDRSSSSSDSEVPRKPEAKSWRKKKFGPRKASRDAKKSSKKPKRDSTAKKGKLLLNLIARINYWNFLTNGMFSTTPSSTLFITVLVIIICYSSY